MSSPATVTSSCVPASRVRFVLAPHRATLIGSKATASLPSPLIRRFRGRPSRVARSFRHVLTRLGGGRGSTPVIWISAIPMGNQTSSGDSVP